MDYVKDVVQQGDAGSRLLAERLARTLEHAPYVETISTGMHGISVVRVPRDYCVVVHSATGNALKYDLAAYATSLIDRLIGDAERIGARPVAFANVIDSPTGDLHTLEIIADTFVDYALRRGIAVVNGENAILGERVGASANLMGTMLSVLPKADLPGITFPLRAEMDGVRYVVLDPRGAPVYMNCDGVGTKMELYERLGRYDGALRDALAMVCDDAVKIAAKVQVVSAIVETHGGVPVDELRREAVRLGTSIGVVYVLGHEHVGIRLRSYAEKVPAYNINATAVSFIDEGRLKRPPTPKAGDFLIAVRGPMPNPRSNGISAIRKALNEKYGTEWHKARDGMFFLSYLTEPSVIFYPLFSMLLELGRASSVYHISGGGLEGKLAQPLARHGLAVEVTNLFPPHEIEIELAELSKMSVRDCMRTRRWGTDGFITTSTPGEAVDEIRANGLEARAVGSLVPSKVGGVLVYDGDKHYLFGFDGKRGAL